MPHPTFRTFMSCAKHWCFTVDTANDAKIAYDEAAMSYLVYQIEEGKQEGRYRHFQGYVAYRIKVRLSTLQRDFGMHAHYEVARGTPEENRAYCTKEEGRWTGDTAGPFEYGTLPRGKGSRSDLAAVATRLNEGCSLRDIAHEFPSEFFRLYKGFAAYQLHVAPSRNRPMHVFVLTGPTGTGKSRSAYEYDNGAFWKPPADGSGAHHWFDGYGGQDTIVWDEFTDSQAPLPFLLRLLDRYPLSVQFKGGYVPFNPKNIVLTSMQAPTGWYGGHLLQPPAIIPELARRISHWIEFNGQSQPAFTACELCTEEDVLFWMETNFTQ